jgi:hypothetical protein
MKISHALIAIVFAVLLSFAGGMEFANQRFEISQTKMLAQDQSERDFTALQISSLNQMLANEDRGMATWRNRAAVCEQKFTVGTILYESRPAATLPLLHGILALSLNDMPASLATAPVPEWMIPVQIEPRTNLPGAQYRWVDLRTGEVKGTFTARAQ